MLEGFDRIARRIRSPSPGILSNEIIQQSRKLCQDFLLKKKKTTPTPASEWRHTSQYPIVKRSQILFDFTFIVNEQRNLWWDIQCFRKKTFDLIAANDLCQNRDFFLVRHFCNNIFQLFSIRIFHRPFELSQNRKSRWIKILICSAEFEVYYVIITELYNLTVYSYAIIRNKSTRKKIEDGARAP